MSATPGLHTLAQDSLHNPQSLLPVMASYGCASIHGQPAAGALAQPHHLQPLVGLLQEPTHLIKPDQPLHGALGKPLLYASGNPSPGAPVKPPDIASNTLHAASQSLKAHITSSLIMFGSIPADLAASFSSLAHTPGSPSIAASSSFPKNIPLEVPSTSSTAPFSQPMMESLHTCPCHSSNFEDDEDVILTFLRNLLPADDNPIPADAFIATQDCPTVTYVANYPTKEEVLAIKAPASIAIGISPPLSLIQETLKAPTNATASHVHPVASVKEVLGICLCPECPCVTTIADLYLAANFFTQVTLQSTSIVLREALVAHLAAKTIILNHFSTCHASSQATNFESTTPQAKDTIGTFQSMLAFMFPHVLSTSQITLTIPSIPFDPGGCTTHRAIPDTEPFLEQIVYLTLALALTILFYPPATLLNHCYSDCFPATISNLDGLMISSPLRGRRSDLQAREIINASNLTQFFKARPLHPSELLIFFIEKSVIDPG